jgi:hypothetical protein
MIEPDMLERWDCETAEYAYFQCAECRKDTKPEAEWADACGEAMDAGWRKIEGEVYCKECLPLIIQRAEENEEEEDESSWRNRNV